MKASMFRNKKTMNKKGTTLIELLLYMGLLSILLVILTDLFVSILNVRLESESGSSVQQDGRYILARLMYDVNSASSIVTPSVGNTTSTMEIVVSGDNFSYAVSGSNLELTNSLGTNLLNSSETVISNPNFQRVGNTIKISFTVTSVTSDSTGQEQKEFTTAVGIR